MSSEVEFPPVKYLLPTQPRTNLLSLLTSVFWGWLTYIYRAGSYLVVFHEKSQDDAPENENLGWLTRNRVAAEIAPELAGQSAEGMFWPYLIITVLVLVPALIGISVELEGF